MLDRLKAESDVQFGNESSANVTGTEMNCLFPHAGVCFWWKVELGGSRECGVAKYRGDVEVDVGKRLVVDERKINRQQSWEGERGVE